MEPKRENTIKLRFGIGTRNPTNMEVFDFFKKQEWTCDDLSAMYREDYCLFVRFNSEKLMADALKTLGAQTSFDYADGSTVSVSVTTACGKFKYIRIFGLPPEVEDKQIAVVMAKYGKIQQMIRERYSPESGFPILNGVRGVHMEVMADIPAQLHIQHIKARVYYDGLQNKCFLCGSLEHLKVDCPRKKSVNERLTASRAKPGTFASIVTNGLSDPASSSRGMVVLNPRPHVVRSPANVDAGNFEENGPASTIGNSQHEEESAQDCGAASADDDENVMEMQSNADNTSIVCQQEEWHEVARKEKGKKRDRKLMRVDSGDTSEGDATGCKQMIVPAPDADLLAAQTTRSKTREARSATRAPNERRE